MERTKIETPLLDAAEARESAAHAKRWQDFRDRQAARHVQIKKAAAAGAVTPGIHPRPKRK